MGILDYKQTRLRLFMFNNKLQLEPLGHWDPNKRNYSMHANKGTMASYISV